MSRRGHGEGTVYKTQQGKWRVQLTVEGRRISKTFSSKRQAMQWRRETLAAIDDGATFRGVSKSLKAFLEEWLDVIKNNHKYLTYKSYETACRIHIIPNIGHIQLIDLGTQDVQHLLNKMSGYSPRTISFVSNTLSSAIKHAVDLGIISRNPVVGTKKPKITKREMTIWNDNEIAGFLVATEASRFEAAYWVALSTGMRISEIIALLWSDIDEKAKTIKVTKQLAKNFTASNPDTWFISTKTDTVREIKISDTLIEKLVEHGENQACQKANPRWQEHNLVFTTRNGTPIAQPALYHDFKSIIRSCGISDIRFHDLRHTAASIMLGNGIPIITVSRILGHSSASMTLDVYGHLMPGAQEKAADLMAEILKRRKT